MMKRISPALLLAALLCVFAAAAAATESGAITLDGILYTLRDADAYYVTAFVEGADTVVYRANVNGRPVVYDPGHINYALPCTAKKLIISEGVTALNDRQFEGWKDLADVTLPTTLTTIGARVFYGAGALEEIVIPEGVETIDMYALSGCPKLT
ncbi:MAG: leucine-rich repeat domain-containing protein, partial [Firmicutes bacterium]|nr:leucine-rich repeat domain-containing protein [Bacillota bacterium]